MEDPIPLITVVPDAADERCPRFEVSRDALAKLGEIKGPLGVITIAGLYRTGKSYILNRLAGLNRGFSVGSRVEPCTQGIFMWIIKNPPADLQRLLKQPDMTIVLLDTEGIGSFTKSKTYDVKMFSLAVLLSSTFIYNSMGAIDDGALDRLALVSELSNSIRIQDSTDVHQLNAYFPKLIWLCRDFGLRLELDGREITADEYLESVLKPLEGDSDKLRARNTIRSSIAQYFPDRRCFTLKRPVSDEKQLQRLEELGEADIRPAFLAQMSALAEHIYTSALPKQLFGKILTGATFARLVGAYVDCMRQGGVPVILSAWENVMAAETEAVVESAIRDWSASWSKDILATMPVDDLFAKWLAITDIATANLRQLCRAKGLEEGATWDAESKLQKFARTALQKGVESNNSASLLKCNDTLKDVKVHLGEVASAQNATFDLLEAAVSTALNEQFLSLNGLGPAKHEALGKFLLKNLVPLARKAHVVLQSHDESQHKSDLERRVQAATHDRGASDALIKRLQASFTQSRAEVDQLVAENQSLIATVAKLGSALDEIEEARGSGALFPAAPSKLNDQAPAKRAKPGAGM